ncbi:hypothetical protein [Lysinibacillus sp. fls2-241-R2A-57]|uniref:hypothetical protein n=1 Tax=Lysinibacillus sp. fls2-241-R2A-57 TaxID=3040292 RepID=UPI002556BEAF|nr:hypothetical protein [Lysinibacillus sp. fls2-241-R2A-57]
METVFAKGLAEKEVKSYMLLGGFAVKGRSLPFFKQISYRKKLPEAFAFLL